MFFTKVPGLERHIYTQQAKSIVYLLLIIAVYCSIPLVMVAAAYDTLPTETASTLPPYLTALWLVVTLWQLPARFIRHECDMREQVRRPDLTKRMPGLNSLFEEVWQQSGLRHRPVVTVANRSEPLASTASSFFSGSYIALSTRALTLPKEQLRGILVHELGHIKHRDQVTTTLINGTKVAAICFQQLFVFALIYFLVVEMVGGASIDEIGWFLAELGIAANALPVTIILLALAHSRTREFLADTFAPAIGGPALSRALADGLIAYRQEPQLRPLTIKGILGDDELLKEVFVLDKYFREHPPVHERIRRLVGE